MRKAIVTGGGGAIAEQVSRRLVQRGYRLTLIDVDAKRVADVASRLPGTTEVIVADLADESQLGDLVALIHSDFSDLALLVNNAGYIEPGDVIDLDGDLLDRHVRINLVAPMRLSQAAARVMCARRSGDILSIISMGGIIAMKTSAAYAASKFGLRGFQTSLRSELAPYGVRVMGVFPSGVDTPMLRHEATHGGSALNFVGKVLTPAQVGAACMKALETGRLETYIPYGDSITTRFFATVPWLIDRVLPPFERKGEKGRARFLAERGLR